MRVEAKLKAAWLHYDPSVLELDNAFNLPLYRHMDKIVLVSRSLKEKYDALYPDLQNKTDFCYNIIDREELLAKSSQPQAFPYPEGRLLGIIVAAIAVSQIITRQVFVLNGIVTFIINGVLCEVCFCLLALTCCRGIRAQRQLEGIALGVLRKAIHKLTR